MNTTEIETRKPGRALLQSEFSVRGGVRRGMSTCTNRAYLGDLFLLLEDGFRHGDASLATTQRSIHVSAERVRSTFQHVHPEA